MNVKFKYVSICLNVLLMHLGTNVGHVISQHTDKVSSGEIRIKRQAGYVYDKPTVSFDIPTATSITTTQAPTVDRIQMQMYYAYPVPAAGAGDTVNVGQQNTVSSAGSTTAVSSSANGYSYGTQNTQVTDARTTLTETQNAVRSGYQNSAITGTQAVVSSGSTGYGDGRPTSFTNSGSEGGSVSTSAPRYLPPKSSGENNVGVSVTTNTQAQTITQPSESYIPSSVQASSVQNDQTSTITQSGSNAQAPPANPSTGYLLPNRQPTPRVSASVSGSTSQVQSQSGPVQTVPTQQYLPPLESSGGQKTIQVSVVAPASTYLPPVF